MGSSFGCGCGTSSSSVRIKFDNGSDEDQLVDFDHPLPTTGVFNEAVGGTFELDPVLDTSAYIDNDVLFDRVELSDAAPEPGGRFVLASLVILDRSNQGQAMDLYFLDQNVSIGAQQAPMSPTAANAAAMLGPVAVFAGDFKQVGNYKMATITGINLPIDCLEDSTSIWVAGVSRGTGTYAANGLLIKLIGI